MFENNKIFILGFARSGYDAAKVLIKRGNQVLINDGKKMQDADKDKLEEFKGSSQGTTTKFLTIKILDEIPIIIPNVVSFMNFSPHMDTLYNNLSVFREENEKLTELQSLLLAKMGQ